MNSRIHPTWFLKALLTLMCALMYASEPVRAQDAAASSGASRLNMLGPALVDSIMYSRFGPGTPGAAVLVARGQTILHRAGYGMAELETARPVRPTTPFYLASLSKPVVALAIDHLIRDGVISTTETIADHFPELPQWTGDVSVKHLLTHTSGIPDYYRFLDWSRFRGLHNQDVIDTLSTKAQLDFRPGERFEYSNSNYVLLSEIVQRVSGMDLDAFLRTRLFEPAGMASTVAFEDTNTFVAGRAYGYTFADSAYRPMDYISFRLQDGTTRPVGFTTTGGGGIYSTVDDLFRLARLLADDGHVGFARFTAPEKRVKTPDASVPDCEYGFGWYVCNRRGEHVIWHAGGFGGFSTMLLHMPKTELTVIVLSNHGQAGSPELAFAISDAFTGRGGAQ